MTIYFVAIFQVAENRLKFGMSALLVLRNVPVSFFKNTEKLHPILPPPPPPPLSIFKQCRISILESQNTVCVSFTLFEGWGGGDARRVGGGGWTFKNVFEALFPRLWKKIQGHFFTEKESCQISDDSEQLGKSLRNSHIQ